MDRHLGEILVEKIRWWVSHHRLVFLANLAEAGKTVRNYFWILMIVEQMEMT